MLSDKRDDIKLTISRNNNLNTTTEKEWYMLSDLMNKIDSKSVSSDEAINSYNDIVKKVKKSCKIKTTKE